MSKYAYDFLVVNEMPTSNDSAESLTLDMNLKYGRNGFELVSVAPIPNTNPAAMLLTFQQEISD